ncbi:sugar transferase [Pedobacter agri]|uniref:Sugar transferase n=2 Tax=Pedobacter agri TaxID=454586 RepID=A0A9X3I9T5_9SPHI|nr:sugar transferase [Pedobacter agri]
MKLVQEWAAKRLPIAAIISNGEILSNNGLALLETLKKNQLAEVPFFLVVRHFNANLRILALGSGVADVFRLPIDTERLEKRLVFLVQNWVLLKKGFSVQAKTVYRVGAAKRAFDILFAGVALILLLPLFIIIAFLIQLESAGPVFYYSLRSGTGFRIFKFYKFRSMYVNADQRIHELKHLNQYDSEREIKDTQTGHSELCSSCKQIGKCQYPMYADGAQWCEKNYDYIIAQKSGSAFFKIANDPRVTKIGNFIRNTSIDELPQLWNVLKGDMSIVGNRPLPIYEAERLTTDRYVLRFAAPAGITGLWQVEKRGKGEMSEEERLMLDNAYAMNQSFWNDIKLILKTIPALFQKENV